MNVDRPKSRFRRLATAGIFFQGGAAAADPGTIVAALVHGLTGNTYAVGAAGAIARYGWLFPQIFVAHLAQGRRRRMPFYMVGAFGRVACLAATAAVLSLAGPLSEGAVAVAFFVLWTVYAFVSGIVAVPYNDIVARSVAAEQRSRLLAWRFFGGGVLALVVAASAERALGFLPFPQGFAAVLALGAGLLLISSLSFVSAGEPLAPPPPASGAGFLDFLSDGVVVWRTDDRFRFFVLAQWLGGAVAMALPFYVLQAITAGAGGSAIAFLLAAQTAGALLSNGLWGWWGDRRGKQSLYEGVALLGAAPPLLVVAWEVVAGPSPAAAIAGFAAVFFLLGAVGNGMTIAMLGYLMEISPDDRRPAYSGYFNALVAPAALLPLAGAAIVEASSLGWVFAVSFCAAFVQYLMARRLRDTSERGKT